MYPFTVQRPQKVTVRSAQKCCRQLHTQEDDDISVRSDTPVTCCSTSEFAKSKPIERCYNYMLIWTRESLRENAEDLPRWDTCSLVAVSGAQSARQSAQHHPTNPQQLFHQLLRLSAKCIQADFDAVVSVSTSGELPPTSRVDTRTVSTPSCKSGPDVTAKYLIARSALKHAGTSGIVTGSTRAGPPHMVECHRTGGTSRRYRYL